MIKTKRSRTFWACGTMLTSNLAKANAFDSSTILTGARHLAVSNITSTTVRDTVPQNRGMSPVAAGVIGAACTFVVVFSVGAIVFAWRKRRRHRSHTSGANAERPSHVPFYKTQPMVATSSYVGLRGVSIDERCQSPSRGPALKLRTEGSIDLSGQAAGGFYSHDNDSSLSLPDNLYMPVSTQGQYLRFFEYAYILSLGRDGDVPCSRVISYVHDTRRSDH
ncbi:hypothetical protein LshimejAT787_0204010 [Lyophyllum shimeji]|uniref:Uncharacterized protein n=1 Tax=Lyophyllum shimeji TaxID=47721 RepID=A0A9P3PFC5_LYOSH|nr:hypothetical protein LshimejAT787_0204010 [Lyophyllum shimeji]